MTLSRCAFSQTSADIPSWNVGAQWRTRFISRARNALLNYYMQQHVVTLSFPFFFCMSNYLSNKSNTTASKDFFPYGNQLYPNVEQQCFGVFISGSELWKCNKCIRMSNKVSLFKTTVLKGKNDGGFPRSASVRIIHESSNTSGDGKSFAQ